MATTLFAVCFVIEIWAIVKSNLAYSWHNKGVGERKGKAEYGRVKREAPDSPDAILSEAEFVEKYVSNRPGMARYALIALAVVFIGMPASCALA